MFPVILYLIIIVFLILIFKLMSNLIFLNGKFVFALLQNAQLVN